mmetsp:Transcript_9433/g.23230  ORF Transcript_9433/g.23230 Transcript_9433/m.23230 type:complete len:200 (+) Transcript_9433:882-1481(+)
MFVLLGNTSPRILFIVFLYRDPFLSTRDSDVFVSFSKVLHSSVDSDVSVPLSPGVSDMYVSSSKILHSSFVELSCRSITGVCLLVSGSGAESTWPGLLVSSHSPVVDFAGDFSPDFVSDSFVDLLGSTSLRIRTVDGMVNTFFNFFLRSSSAYSSLCFCLSLNCFPLILHSLSEIHSMVKSTLKTARLNIALHVPEPYQ